MEASAKFKEQRENPRFKVGIPVEYRALRDSPGIKKGSILRDLSLGGARFITDEFLAFTARLVLDIALPLPDRTVSAVSKVAWIKKLPASDKYEVGSQFLEMAKDDKNRLSDYLDRLAASRSFR